MKRQRKPLGELCTLVKGKSPISKTTPGPYTLVTTGETHKTAECFQFDTEAVCIPLISSTGHGHASLKRVHYVSGKFALANLLAAAVVKNRSVLSSKFLTRYLMFSKDRLIVPLMTGAANMSISLDRLATVPIAFPSLAEQERIVKLLDEADELRQLCDQADRRTAQLIPALFHEMFGDPATNPKGWTCKYLGEVVKLNPKLPKENQPDFETKVSFVPMAAVDEVLGIIASSETKQFREVSKGYTPFQNGDVLFAKITPCMQNGKSAIGLNLVNGFGYGSTEFHVLRPGETVSSEYVFWLVRRPEFRALAEKYFTGAAGQQRVPASFLENYPSPIPPLALQKEFAERVKEIRVLETAQTASRRRTEALFQSLEHQAFNGEL